MAAVSLDVELKGKLLEYLGALEAGVKTGGEALAGEAHKVAAEIVAYNMAVSAISCVAATGIILMAALTIVFLAKNMDEFEKDSPGFAPCGIIATLIAGFIFPGIWFCFSTATLLKCYFAPRLFVLEYIMAMLPGHSG